MKWSIPERATRKPVEAKLVATPAAAPAKAKKPAAKQKKEK